MMPGTLNQELAQRGEPTRATKPRPVFCLAEDRAAEEIGLRLAPVSLRQCCPGASVIVYRPNPTDDFRGWVRGLPNVTLIPQLPAGAFAWNCKPHALLPLLEEGWPEVVWLDSDILLARDCLPLFDGLGEEE